MLFKIKQMNVKVDAIRIIMRDGKKYKQVSYWELGKNNEERCRYSTVVPIDFPLPSVGSVVPYDAVHYKGEL